MKKITFLIFVACICICNLMSQKLTDPINNDPNVKIGKLSNGLTYYIRENKKPENRAEFWLVVNAGSVQENENQLGLAHFTEHMGFNGIKGFPGNKITDELAKVGVSFGREINAFTSFDRTVYTLTMPTDNSKNIDMAMNILKGWAHEYLLDNKEIDEERGVIVEEYRLGLGPDDRMMKKWIPVMFNGSRYADRMPIGTLEVLENFKHQTLKDFYYDWYRPDLQAIVVVGDVKTSEIEKMIIDKFSKIKPKKNPREKIIYPIKSSVNPRVSVCTDKEAGISEVMIVRTFPHFVMKTVGDYRTAMTHSLFNNMYNSRLIEKMQDPSTPFVGAHVGYSSFLGNTDAYFGQVSPKGNHIIESLKEIMQEDYRVLKYGFLESELKRAKDELLNQYEIAANEIDKTESKTFSSEYMEHYVQNDPIPGAKRVFNYAKKFLEEITIDEINVLAKNWITKENICVVITAPEKEELVVPSEKEILAIVTDASLANVDPYIDTYKEQEMVDVASLQKGKIISESVIPEVDVTEVTLNNGIKVWLKKTDFKNDEILFNAMSKGGMCLYGESDLASGFFAADLVDRGGIGEIDFISLIKKMKGKKVGVSPNISVFSEEMSGSATPKDLEFFFQYIHAFFTSPRYDPTVYELIMKETIEQLKMIDAMPMYRAIKNLVKVFTQNDFYSSIPFGHLLFNEEFINSANYDRAFEIYKERFANPADFHFNFIGNFDEKIMREYLELYLGSLKTTEVKEDINTSVVKGFPEKQVIEDIYIGTEEQGFVGIAYQKEFPWNYDNKIILAALKDALDIELVAEIREKMSGVYSPMCIMSWNHLPKPEFIMVVFFGCAPNNADNLSNAVFKILKEMQQNGPSEETMAKVKQQLIKQRETQLKTNGYWNQILANMWFQNDDIRTIPTFVERLNTITAKDIADFLQKYFDVEHYVRVNTFPEK